MSLVAFRRPGVKWRGKFMGMSCALGVGEEKNLDLHTREKERRRWRGNLHGNWGIPIGRKLLKKSPGRFFKVRKSEDEKKFPATTRKLAFFAGKKRCNAFLNLNFRSSPFAHFVCVPACTYEAGIFFFGTGERGMQIKLRCRNRLKSRTEAEQVVVGCVHPPLWFFSLPRKHRLPRFSNFHNC